MPVRDPAWRAAATVATRRGRVDVRAREGPAVFLADPSGVIGPVLLAEALDRAAAFGRAHPDGWCYVADVRGVRYADPRNARHLRRIRDLPHVSAYLVVAPRLALPLARLAAAASRHGPQAVHATVEAAVADARRRLTPPGA